jgi:hypothetical protein
MEFTCLGAALHEFAKGVKTNFSELVKLLESIQMACSDFRTQILRVRQDHEPARLTCGYDRPEQVLCAFADQLIASVIGPVERLTNCIEVLRGFGTALSAGMEKYVRSAGESNYELRNAVKALRTQIMKAVSTMSLHDHRQVARQTKETKQLLHNAADSLGCMLELVQLGSIKAHTAINGLLLDFPNMKFQRLEAVPSAGVEAFRAKIHDELNIVTVFEKAAIPAIPAILPAAFDPAAPSGHQIVDPLMLESKCACPISAKLSSPLPFSIGNLEVTIAGSLPSLKSGTLVTVVEGGYKKIWEVQENGFRYPRTSLDLTF